MLSKRKEIADFMAANRIPAIYPFNEYAGVGACSFTAQTFPSCSNGRPITWTSC
jgi:hypothetical protein